jgi:arsenate reductase (glutaredoxin)
MSACTVYFNPHCSKSRRLLELLADRGVSASLVDYLAAPPGAAELRSLVQALGDEAAQLLRSEDAAFATLGVDAADLTPTAIVEVLLQHPQLLQRPVVVYGARVVIARPPERALELF